VSRAGAPLRRDGPERASQRPRRGPVTSRSTCEWHSPLPATLKSLVGAHLCITSSNALFLCIFMASGPRDRIYGNEFHFKLSAVVKPGIMYNRTGILYTSQKARPFEKIREGRRLPRTKSAREKSAREEIVVVAIRRTTDGVRHSAPKAAPRLYAPMPNQHPLIRVSNLRGPVLAIARVANASTRDTSMPPQLLRNGKHMTSNTGMEA
jgi:hypothetical protein